MRWYVDGQEIPTGAIAEVKRVGDRLMVYTPEGAFSAVAVRAGETILISYKGRQFTLARQALARKDAAVAASGEILAPMPGQIVDVRVKVGDTVTEGEPLLVLEAMKTQQVLLAPFDGVVLKVQTHVGATVSEAEILAKLDRHTDA